MSDFFLMVSGALFAMVVSGIVNYRKSAWQGLTDADIEDAILESGLIDDYPQKFVQIIEAKLKEKNT